MLMIRRARILKQARGKVQATACFIERYQPGDRWLVYCDDITQLKALTKQCLEAGLPGLEFYSEMMSDRDAVIRSLSQHGGIIIAIRASTKASIFQ